MVYLGGLHPWTHFVVPAEDDGFLLKDASFDVKFSVARFALGEEFETHLRKPTGLGAMRKLQPHEERRDINVFTESHHFSLPMLVSRCPHGGSNFATSPDFGRVTICFCSPGQRRCLLPAPCRCVGLHRIHTMPSIKKKMDGSHHDALASAIRPYYAREVTCGLQSHRI